MALKFTVAGSQHLTLVQDSALDSLAQCTGMLWVVFTDLVPATSNLISWSVGPPPGTSTVSRFAMQAFPTGTCNILAKSTDAEGSQTTTAPAATVSAGPLYHIAGVVDFTAKTERLYVNGALVASGNALGFGANTTPATDSKSASLNSEDDGSTAFSNCTMSDVRLYNRALSAGEIATIYITCGTDGIMNGLVRQWMLNEDAPGVAAVSNLVDLVNRVALVPFNSPTFANTLATRRRRTA
jgi:hypothetical protein